MRKITEEEVLSKLRDVNDPEFGVSIVDMGLVYGVKIKGGDSVEIEMTLTSFSCPLGGLIEEEVAEKLKKELNLKKVKIKFVFDPPWSPKLMSKELRARFGV